MVPPDVQPQRGAQAAARPYLGEVGLVSPKPPGISTELLELRAESDAEVRAPFPATRKLSPRSFRDRDADLLTFPYLLKNLFHFIGVFT